MIRKKLFVILTGFISLFFIDDSLAQCNNGALTETCISELDSSYSFLKSYALESADQSISSLEYSYVLTKGTDYIVNICQAEDSPGIHLKIFNANRKEFAATTDSSSVLQFTCSVTGIYYLNFEFAEEGNKCGSAVLGFKSE